MTTSALFGDVQAIGWSTTMGLIPGYAHENDPQTADERRAHLASVWSQAMENTIAHTGFTISAVMAAAIVVYPEINGCPDGGERVVTISGSSNPSRVTPEQFDAFVEAVEATVLAVRAAMEQNSVRIEFTLIRRSTYFRADGKY